MKLDNIYALKELFHSLYFLSGVMETFFPALCLIYKL